MVQNYMHCAQKFVKHVPRNVVNMQNIRQVVKHVLRLVKSVPRLVLNKPLFVSASKLK